MAEIVVTDETFEQEVLKSDLPVLVDFWAEWCGPCKMIAPILSELAKEYEGKLKVARLNVDENQLTAARYQIMAIPTLILFKGSIIIDQFVGVQPKKVLQQKIDKIVK